MLSQGTVDFDTPEFKLTLVRSSQTVAALRPKGADDFDFTPGDLLVSRSHDGYFHLGDITFRLRVGNSGSWKNYSTACNSCSGHSLAGIKGRSGGRRFDSHATDRLSPSSSSVSGHLSQENWFCDLS